MSTLKVEEEDEEEVLQERKEPTTWRFPDGSTAEARPGWQQPTWSTTRRDPWWQQPKSDQWQASAPGTKPVWRDGDPWRDAMRNQMWHVRNHSIPHSVINERNARTEGPDILNLLFDRMPPSSGS